MKDVKESPAVKLQSAIKPFIAFRTGFVRERASEQLQSVMRPFHKGLVKERASAQLQSVIKPSRKEFVLPKQRASERAASLYLPAVSSRVSPSGEYRFAEVVLCLILQCRGTGHGDPASHVTEGAGSRAG